MADWRPSASERGFRKADAEKNCQTSERPKGCRLLFEWQNQALMTTTERIATPPPVPERERIAAAVRMTIAEGRICVTGDSRTDIPLGLQIHTSMRDAVVRNLMGRSGGTISKPAMKVRCCEFSLKDQKRATELLRALRLRLLKIAQRPISAGRAEELLNITAAERNRWSKSGTLRIFGSAQIRRGRQLVSLFTYPPGVVEALSEAPDLIAAWRLQESGKS